jgi:hypothetical protein
MMCHPTVYTCVVVFDPLLAVQNYSMWMFSNLYPLTWKENDENCVVANVYTVFWFNKQNEFETESFSVLIEMKQTEEQPKQCDREYILVFLS